MQGGCDCNRTAKASFGGNGNVPYSSCSGGYRNLYMCSNVMEPSICMLIKKKKIKSTRELLFIKALQLVMKKE